MGHPHRHGWCGHDAFPDVQGPGESIAPGLADVHWVGIVRLGRVSKVPLALILDPNKKSPSGNFHSPKSSKQKLPPPSEAASPYRQLKPNTV